MTEPTQQPKVVAASVDVSIDAKPSLLKHLLTRHMRYPNSYAWLLLVSSMDIMMTWVILLFGGAEVNPLARWIIDHYGLPGMIVYKFALIVFFICICEIVGTLRDRTGRLLSKVSVAIGCVPVVWAMFLLARYNLS
ncbi:MAG: DUF5658 family protein [Phycisphaeraceae bacterium]